MWRTAWQVTTPPFLPMGRRAQARPTPCQASWGTLIRSAALYAQPVTVLQDNHEPSQHYTWSELWCMHNRGCLMGWLGNTYQDSCTVHTSSSTLIQVHHNYSQRPAPSHLDCIDHKNVFLRQTSQLGNIYKGQHCQHDCC